MLIHAYSCQTWQSVKLVKANAILSKILICVLVVDNPLFYLMSVQFTEKCSMYNLLCKIQ